MPNLEDFDTTQLSEEGVDMELLDPNGDPIFQDEEKTKPVTIRVLGRDSEQFMRTQRRQIERRLQRQRGQRMRQIPIEELVEEQSELLAAVTVNWSGIEEKSASVPFNPANVRRIYKNYPWIREQVDNFIGDRANFMKSASNGSGATLESSSSSISL